MEKHILENEAESRAYFIQMWAEAMELYRADTKHDLKLPKEMEDYLKEMQKEFMPEDTNIGLIQTWLDECGEEYVCSRMILENALNQDTRELKQWQTKKISEIMNNSITGWEPVSSHRFIGTIYGTQRAWKRVSVPEGFISENAEKAPFI